MAQVGRNMRLEEMLEECATMSLSEEKEEFSGWEISTVFFTKFVRTLLPPGHVEDQPRGGAVQGALHGEERQEPQEEEQEAGRPWRPGLLQFL